MNELFKSVIDSLAASRQITSAGASVCYKYNETQPA